MRFNRRNEEIHDPEVNKILGEIAENKSSVFFYPSAGFRHQHLFSLAYDAFVLVDQLSRSGDQWKQYATEWGCDPDTVVHLNHCTVLKSGNKVILFFHCDNNQAFNVLRRNGVQITLYSAVCCGCGEGGNWECCNDVQWLEMVFHQFPSKGGLYVTDHSDVLDPFDPRSIKRTRFSRKQDTTKLFEDFDIKCILNESYDNPTKLTKSFFKIIPSDNGGTALPFRPFYTKFLMIWKVKRIEK